MDNLSDIGFIKKILGNHGFNFSKALGQNFLVNPSVCPKMAQASVTGENIGVIEIGPGIGVLTNELAKRAKKVVAIEIDKRLIPVLKETLAEHSNVEVINADILKVNLKELINEKFSGMDVVVCANLPYYITSPVIMKLLEEKLEIRSITVMVQKEVAKRLCAGVGTREAGAVTIAVNYYSEPELLFTVKAGSFMPAPKVDSAVIKLNILLEPKHKVLDEKTFFKVIKAGFSQRRKTLINSLSAGICLSKQELGSIFDRVNIDPTSRAEDLQMEQFAALADEIYNLSDSNSDVLLNC